MRVMGRAAVASAWLVAATLALAACDADPRSAAAGDGVLTVCAASSLRDAFVALADQFARAHPGVTVTFNFAGTQELRRQIEQGASCDVLAAADRRHMDALASAGQVRDPQMFARSRPVIAVAREATSTIRALEDLPAADRIVVGAPEVPIGAYTLELLSKAESRLGAGFAARVQQHVVSRELNVRQVLAKVRLGEAQAGVVYASDVHGLTDVGVVKLPDWLDVTAAYPIAVVGAAPHPAARAFVDLVLSPGGQATLARAGLLARAEGG
ncbi:MAG: molybdate ABC transporter substrate-binding protein [Deltaproteobacteria bacterium RBG_16_71_12]|nr:MAG: molybdate ABC transporter substrate-binding protein [Deltaproteobacteria bacterium RBG_16_71_12]